MPDKRPDVRNVPVPHARLLAHHRHGRLRGRSENGRKLRARPVRGEYGNVHVCRVIRARERYIFKKASCNLETAAAETKSVAYK